MPVFEVLLRKVIGDFVQSFEQMIGRFLRHTVLKRVPVLAEHAEITSRLGIVIALRGIVIERRRLPGNVGLAPVLRRMSASIAHRSADRWEPV